MTVNKTQSKTSHTCINKSYINVSIQTMYYMLLQITKSKLSHMRLTGVLSNIG